MSQLQALLYDRRIDPLLLGAAASADNVLRRAKIIGKNPDIDTGSEDLIDGGGTLTVPTAARIHALVSSNTADKGGVRASGTITIDHYDQMLAAAARGTFQVVDADKMVGIRASGAITVVDWQLARNIAAVGTITYGAPANDDTIVVDGTTFTKKASGNGTTEFSTIAELNTLINGLASVNSSSDGTTITITAASKGTAGNSITLSKTGSALTLSGATLAGGQTGLTLSLAGVDYVEGVDFTAVTSNAATATAIATLLGAVSGYDATADGAVVTVLADIVAAGGTEGNVALATSKISAATVSGATLTGGRSYTKLTVASTDLVAGTDFDVDSEDDERTARNIAEAINDGVSGVSATYSGEIVTVVDDDADETGNSTALTSSNTAAVLASASALAGGEDLSTITVNGVAFVAGDDFEVGASNTEAATNLAAAINASEDVLIDGVLTASASGAVVTVTAVAEGTGGNSLTLARDDSDSVSVSGATLANGRAASTGARTVLVTGVDATYAEISETVILNGTSSVNTVNSYLRINSMEVLTVGSGGVPAGNITATAATDSTVSCRILAGNNVSFHGWYTVPLGYTAYILGIDASAPGEATGILTTQIMTRAVGAGFVERDAVTMNAALGVSVAKTMLAPIPVTEKTDIKLVTTSDTDNIVARGVLDLLVVAN